MTANPGGVKTNVGFGRDNNNEPIYISGGLFDI